MTRSYVAVARTDLAVRDSAARAGEVVDRMDASRGIWPIALPGGGVVGGVATATIGALGSFGPQTVIAIGGPALPAIVGGWSGGPGPAGPGETAFATPGAAGASGAAPAPTPPAATGVATLASVDVGGFAPPAPADGFGAPIVLAAAPGRLDGGDAAQAAANDGDGGTAGGGSGLAGLFGFLSDLFDAGPFQANVSFSDHDATSISASITYIGSIVDSTVFLGANTAIATALNIAPVVQANWGGFGGGGAADQLNLAVTDNDATAVAFAGTFIGAATNSVIHVGGTQAASLALNLAPTTQTNLALLGDPPAGDALGAAELAQLNGALGDNDALAAAQAAVLIGEEALAPATTPADLGSLAADLGPLPTLDPGTLAALIAVLSQPEDGIAETTGDLSPMDVVPVAPDAGDYLDDGLVDMAFG